jgi:dihydrofolate reductase
LPGRRNVVLTRDPAWTAEGAEVVHSPDEVDTSAGEVWVAGGAAVYAAFLPVAARILRTRIDLDVPGDTRAPELADDWVVESDTGWRASENGLRYISEELVRAAQSDPPRSAKID